MVGDLQRCLVTRGSVRPGKVEKKHLLMVLVQVVAQGLQHKRCRYWTRSGFERRLYTFDTCLVGVVVGFSFFSRLIGV